MEGLAFYWYHQKCRKELAAMKVQRNDERQGRITAQQRLRKSVKEETDANGYLIKPIGFVESPYSERRGTPRQPMLVPAAHGRIRFDKHLIQAEHFQELSQFSHLWVVFMFHENTNTDNSTICAKIKPPRLLGKKVGCLSTRSPHRPNAIGLSVCKILGVTNDSVEISCIDMMDGTPVLDVKPYLPWDVIPTPLYNSTRNIVQPTIEDAAATSEQSHGERLPRVPEWIRDTAPQKPVYFTTEAITGLNELGEQEQSFKYCSDVAHAKAFLTQVLCQDIRGAYQGRGGASVDIPIELLFPGSSSKDAADDTLPATETPLSVTYHEVQKYIAVNKLNGRHVIYICNLDCMYIEFVTTHNIILVLRIADNKGQVGGYWPVPEPEGSSSTSPVPVWSGGTVSPVTI